MELVQLKAFVDEVEKIAAPVNLSKAKGFARVKEVVTGSRAAKLKDRAENLANRGASISRGVKEKGTSLINNKGKDPLERTDEAIKYVRRGAGTEAKHYNAGQGALREHYEESAKKNFSHAVAGIGSGVGLGATALHLYNKEKKQKADK